MVGPVGQATVGRAKRTGGRPTTIRSLATYVPPRVLTNQDLEKMVSRYSGTSSGAEAAMLLAQLHFDQARFQEGVTVLENAAKWQHPKGIESLSPAVATLLILRGYPG